jgi:hypothetical protein
MRLIANCRIARQAALISKRHQERIDFVALATIPRISILMACC